LIGVIASLLFFLEERRLGRRQIDAEVTRLLGEAEAWGYADGEVSLDRNLWTNDHHALRLAKQFARRATETDPSSAEARSDLSRYTAFSGNLPGAERIVDEAFAQTRHADHCRLFETRGLVMWLQGRKSEALDAMRRATELHPDESTHHFHLAQGQFLVAQLDEGFKSASRAAALSTDVRYLDLLLQIGYFAGQDAEAAEAGLALARRDEMTEDRALLLVLALMREDRDAEAQEIVREYLGEDDSIMRCFPGGCTDRAYLDFAGVELAPLGEPIVPMIERGELAFGGEPVKSLLVRDYSGNEQ